MADTDNAQAASRPAGAVDTATNETAPDGKVSYREIVGLRKELRAAETIRDEMTKALTEMRSISGQKQTSANGTAPASDVAGKLAEMEARLAFRDAMESMDHQPSKTERALLERLYRAEKPADLQKWLTETTPHFIKKAATEEASTNQKEATTQSPPIDGGILKQAAPAANGHTSLPDDPRLIPVSIWQGMTSKDRLAYWERFKVRNGVGVNPFRKT